MKTYKYRNYDDYIKSQRAGYEKKKIRVWVNKENIKFICDNVLKEKYINSENGRGLCHGVRTGKEVEWFIEYLPGWGIIGTEIGDSKNDHIIQWDFNKQKLEWIDRFDFIYSNSFDHSFDISTTLKIWAEQLKSGGIMILEMNRSHEHTGEISRSVNKTDPTGIKFKELTANIPVWIKDAKIINILDMPVVTKEWRKTIIIEVQK